jgi:hypothetical protein
VKHIGFFIWNRRVFDENQKGNKDSFSQNREKNNKI